MYFFLTRCFWFIKDVWTNTGSTPESFIIFAQQKHISSGRVRRRGYVAFKNGCSAHKCNRRRNKSCDWFSEFWLLLLLIKSMGLSWSCSFSFSGNFRDVLTGHYNHGCIVIKISYIAVFYCNVITLEAWCCREWAFFLRINYVGTLFYKLRKQITYWIMDNPMQSQ